METRIRTGLFLCILCTIASIGAAGPPNPGNETLGGGSAAAFDRGGATMAFTLTSSAFKNGENIPKKHTCEGQDVSPPLDWADPPQGTQSYALIADDPDAPGGTWVHWVAYDLPPSMHQLPEGVPKTEEISGGGRQGINDFRRAGYGGPCPPPGSPHRYFFKLYALNAMLNLKPKASKKEVEQAMQGHVIGQTELMGKYKR